MSDRTKLILLKLFCIAVSLATTFTMYYFIFKLFKWVVMQMSQRCDECKHYREANAYVFDKEKSYCAKGYDIGYAQLDYSLYDKKCKDYINKK